MKNKYLIFFIIEFILFTLVLLFTFPIFVDDLQVGDGAYPYSSGKKAFLYSIILIIIYFVKVSFRITIPDDTKLYFYLSEILSITIGFIGRISLIVLSSYMGYYYIKNFGITNNFKFIFGSIIILIAIYLFSRDSVKLSQMLSKQ